MSLLNRSNADFSLKNQHIVKLMFCVVFAVLFFSCVTGFASAYPVTITFEANGGTVSPSTITVEAGEYFTLPTPVYEGRTFTSWYGGIKMDMWHDAGERVCVYTDFTFVASWVPQYTITFNPDGGLVNPSSITVESGTYITLPEPTRDGYSFISWYGFAKEIFEQMNLDVNLQECTTEEFPRPAKRPAYSVMNNGGLCRDWKVAFKRLFSIEILGKIVEA